MSQNRKVAVSALLRAENSGYSNIVLREVLGLADLNDTDKAFVTTVFYGVLERKITIDYILNKFLKKPIKKAPPYTKTVLRSAAYQILFMDKVPASAAVNEGVRLIKNSKERGNSGLVNAVLRKVSELNLTHELKSAPLYVKYSVEPWILESLVADYGEKATADFLQNSLMPPPVFVRINTLNADNANAVISEITEQGGRVEKTDIKDLYSVFGLKAPEKLKTYKEGGFFVQDYSSRMCTLLADVKPGMRVLDCCAAPGGKSFSLAIDMENKGEIYSLDIHPHRVDLISAGAERLGLTSVKALPLDATAFNKKLGEFDVVLCDVPCSGVGVIRRKPEIKYKSDAECKELLDIQKDILNTASKYLKKGGRLIYSTCTLLKRENEGIIEEFLKANKDFALLKTNDFKNPNTFMPPLDKGDGFFVSLFERL